MYYIGYTYIFYESNLESKHSTQKASLSSAASFRWTRLASGHGSRCSRRVPRSSAPSSSDLGGLGAHFLPGESPKSQKNPWKKMRKILKMSWKIMGKPWRNIKENLMVCLHLCTSLLVGPRRPMSRKASMAEATEMQLYLSAWSLKT